MQLLKRSASVAQISCAKVFVTEHCLASSNQRAANSVTVAPWHTKPVVRMLIASKAAFLENYLAVSTSIECH